VHVLSGCAKEKSLSFGPKLSKEPEVKAVGVSILDSDHLKMSLERLVSPFKTLVRPVLGKRWCVLCVFKAGTKSGSRNHAPSVSCWRKPALSVPALLFPSPGPLIHRHSVRFFCRHC